MSKAHNYTCAWKDEDHILIVKSAFNANPDKVSMTMVHCWQMFLLNNSWTKDRTSIGALIPCWWNINESYCFLLLSLLLMVWHVWPLQNICEKHVSLGDVASLDLHTRLNWDPWHNLLINLYSWTKIHLTTSIIKSFLDRICDGSLTVCRPIKWSAYYFYVDLLNENLRYLSIF